MTADLEARRMWSRDTLAAHLENEVVRLAQANDSTLPSERALSETMGVSRSLVREVLSGLEQRGLIEIVPGKGAFARDPGMLESARSMREAIRAGQATHGDLVEARAALEHHTAALAAERATPADLDALGNALADLDAADSLVARASADIAFHALLARAAHNPVLVTMFDSISGLVFETILRSIADAATSGHAAPDHHLVLESVRRGDAAAAARAMTEHVQPAEARDGSDVDERLDGLVADILHRSYGPAVSLDAVVADAVRRYSRDQRPGSGKPT